MTRFLLLAALLLGLLPAHAQRLVSQTVTVGPGQRVVLKFNYANLIRVRPGSGSTLSVQASVSINDNQQNDAFSLKLDQTGDEVYVAEALDGRLLHQASFRGRCQGTTNNGTDNASGNRYSYCIRTDYEVTVPAGVALQVSSVSGNIDVQGLSGAVNAQTTSGSITLQQLTGAVLTRSTSGDITLRQTTGTVAARDISGNVTLTEPGPNAVELTSVSGDVAATWPTSHAATLALKSVSGEVYADPAVTFSNLRPDGRVGYELRGSYGSGSGPAVRLQSVSGNVFFRQAR